MADTKRPPVLSQQAGAAWREPHGILCFGRLLHSKAGPRPGVRMYACGAFLYPVGGSSGPGDSPDEGRPGCPRS